MNIPKLLGELENRAFREIYYSNDTEQVTRICRALQSEYGGIACIWREVEDNCG